MRSGQRVSHPTFGAGVVSTVNFTGSQKRVHVDFGYTQAWIVFDALRVLSDDCGAAVRQGDDDAMSQSAGHDWKGPDDPRSPRVVWSKDPLLTESQTEARKGIAALRLGQPLENQARQLSVGTESTQQEFKKALTRALGGKPTFVLIDGSWGGGKTHALTLLQALAREAQMTIGSAVMDGVAVTLSEPNRLMEAILGSVRVPGDASADGISQLLRAAKSDGKSSRLRARGAHQVADALDGLPLRAFDDTEALQCIEDYFSLALSGAQIRSKLRQLGYEAGALPVLTARMFVERPRGFAVLLKSWAQAFAVMGAKGLVVVLDELDVEYASSANSNQACAVARARRRAVLKHLSGLASQEAPLLIAFASAPGGADVGSENDAVEDVRLAIGRDLIHIRAVEPSEDHLEQLLTRLSSLYETAYPAEKLGVSGPQDVGLFTGLHARYRRSPNPVPRHFVRSALEAFDLLTAGEKSFGDVVRFLGATD